MALKKLAIAGASALAIFAISEGAANATDYTPPEQTLVYDWTGFYAGLHIGYGEQTTRFYTDNETSPGSCPGPVGAFCNTSRSANSMIFGGQAGFNYQAGNFVFGIEGDASWAGMEATAYRGSASWCCTSRKNEIDTLASLRGRLGWAFDRVLFYGTGGIGYVHGVAHKDTDSQFDGRTAVSAFAPVVGGGLAWAYNDHISVRAEGLYFFVNDVATLSDDKSIHTENVWVARLGLDYKF